MRIQAYIEYGADCKGFYLPLGCVLSNDSTPSSVPIYPLPLEAFLKPYRGIYEGEEKT